jgi:ADP-ribose pyrophosphatase
VNAPQPPRKLVFSTPWFQILEADSGTPGRPNYSIDASDFAFVVAVTPEGALLLVRQFRHAVGTMTLELPAGHVEAGETPEQAARKELIEETGYVAETFVSLGSFSPSAARFTNRMWCFFAADARPAPDAEQRREAGIELVLYRKGWRALLREPDFFSAHSCAALLAALAQGKLQP